MGLARFKADRARQQTQLVLLPSFSRPAPLPGRFLSYCWFLTTPYHHNAAANHTQEDMKTMGKVQDSKASSKKALRLHNNLGVPLF